MTSQVIFKIDTKLKDQAMKKAKSEGVPFALVLKMATTAYIKGALDVELVAQPKLRPTVRRELMRISKDIKAGKNLVGPFKTVEEMKKYLMS